MTPHESGLPAVPRARLRPQLRPDDGARHRGGADVGDEDARASGRRRHDSDLGRPRRSRQHEHGRRAQGRARRRARDRRRRDRDCSPPARRIDLLAPLTTSPPLAARARRGARATCRRSTPIARRRPTSRRIAALIASGALERACDRSDFVSRLSMIDSRRTPFFRVRLSRLASDARRHVDAHRHTRTIRAPRGTTLSCKGWPQEAALRMLMNNLDPDVAERPEDLVVYGGSGRAARSWPAFDAIVALAASRSSTTKRCSCSPASRSAIFRTHPVGAARAHRQRAARARLGQLEDVPRSRRPRPDDVRPDDGRIVDLHRHAGHSAGHLRDAGRRRPPAFRRHAARHADGHGRPRRHGRRPAAGRHDERRRRARHRGRSDAHRAPPRDALSRRSRRRRSTRRWRAPPTTARAASRARSASRPTPPTCCRRSSRAASRRTS